MLQINITFIAQTDIEDNIITPNSCEAKYERYIRWRFNVDGSRLEMIQRCSNNFKSTYVEVIMDIYCTKR